MNEDEAERQRGIRFFLAFAAGAAVAELSVYWLLAVPASGVVFLGGYRWTQAPRT